MKKTDEQLNDVEEAVFKPEIKRVNNHLMKLNSKGSISSIMMRGMQEHQN